MFKKIASSMILIFLLVSTGIFVSGGGVYDITDIPGGGTTAFNNVRVDGALGWQYTFTTLGGNETSTNTQPRLEVNWPGNTKTSTAEAYWGDWPAGATIKCYASDCGSYVDRTVVDGYVTPEACRQWGSPCPGWTWWERYYPYHFRGENISEITPVPDVPNTYTFNLKAYGDGLTNSEFRIISDDGGSAAPYDCSWFYIDAGGSGSSHDGVDGCPSSCYWQAGVYNCAFADPNDCLNGAGGDAPLPGWEGECNGVYALVQFFDDSTPLGTVYFESDDWVYMGSDTPITYTSYYDGIAYRTDNTPGAEIEFQRAITITADCIDEDTCTSPTTSGCNSASQKWECVMQGDGCYDNVTTDCGSCAECSAGSCTSFCLDCGLRVYNGTDILTVACAPQTYYPLKIRTNTGTYSVVLVDPADPNATKMRIYNGTDTLALRELPS